MKPPIFVRTLSKEERKALKAGLRSSGIPTPGEGSYILWGWIDMQDCECAALPRGRDSERNTHLSRIGLCTYPGKGH